MLQRSPCCKSKCSRQCLPCRLQCAAVLREHQWPGEQAGHHEFRPPIDQNTCFKPRQTVTIPSLWFVQAQVEGVPFDNVAPLPNVTMVCNTSLYVIDEVMLPSSSISNIPGFTSIGGLQCVFAPSVANPLRSKQGVPERHCLEPWRRPLAWQLLHLPVQGSWVTVGKSDFGLTVAFPCCSGGRWPCRGAAAVQRHL